MSCASCIHCSCGKREVQYAKQSVCEAPGCKAIATVAAEDKERFQSADAPVHDPEATEELRLKLENEITSKYPDNPFRPKLVTALNGRKCLVWGAPHKYPSHPQGLGLTTGTHMKQVVKVYENEKTKDEKGFEHGRFLHINTGTHGDEKGETISPVAALLPAKLQEYMKDAEKFMKDDITWLKNIVRTSLFLVNSRCLPIYPDDKDTLDAWCMSKLLQADRIELYNELQEHLKTLRK